MWQHQAENSQHLLPFPSKPTPNKKGDLATALSSFTMEPDLATAVTADVALLAAFDTDQAHRTAAWANVRSLFVAGRGHMTIAVGVAMAVTI